jgi:glycosyltransferase involved in cell wall biosynthesis
MSDLRVSVIQDGARLHYAMPLAFHQRGVLERVFCEWYSRPGSIDRKIAGLVSRVRPALGRRMLDRYAPGLEGANVLSHPVLTWRTLRRRKRFPSPFAFCNYESERRAQWILRQGYGNSNLLCGFIRNLSPTLAADARKRGLITIADQIIAPAAIEREEDAIQRERFPDWPPDPGNDEYAAVEAYERRTWEHLDHITCASDYVRAGLLGQGIAPERVSVIPYPIDASRFSFVDRSQRPGMPLRVGFVGSISLRKGAPYFLEVARQFDPAKIRFAMVGPIRVSDRAVGELSRHVELPQGGAGGVPRSEIAARLAGFDLFYFPSTCEGSAGSVLEAMMTGLPIITSPNSGSVVRDGLDGCILRYDDVEGAVHAIGMLADSTDRRLAAGRSAADRARSYDLARYGTRLVDAIGRARQLPRSPERGC